MFYRTNFLVVVVTLMTLLLHPLHGETYIYVDNSVSSSGNGTSSSPFQTIQEALDAVENDQTTVIIRDGTYTGEGNVNLQIYDAKRTITSESGDYGSVSIDCTNNNTAIAVVKGTLFLTGIKIKNCVGTIRDLSNTNLTIKNETIVPSDTTNTIGGALWIQNSYALIKDCYFEGNSAENGGVLYESSAAVTFSACTLANNEASSLGGAVYAINSYLVFNDSSKVINNVAALGGGGIYMDNTVVEFDEGSYISYNSATNKNGNEIFCDGGAGTFYDGSYIISSNVGRLNFIDNEDTVCDSDCGLATSDGSTDYCDVIANETTYIYVDDDANCVNATTWECDGSEDSPYNTISAALNVADSQTVIILKDGTYTGSDNINLEIYDSYRRIRSENSESADNVIIDCNGNGFGIAFVKGSFFLTGVTVRDCVASKRNLTGLPLGNGTAKASNMDDTIGGGLWMENVYAEIINCSFEENTGDIGAGIYSYYSTVFMQGTGVDGNVASMEGGGIYVWSGYMSLNDTSKVVGNEATNAGGGVYIKSATVELDGGSYIAGNNANDNGNEVYCESGAGTLSGDANLYGTGFDYDDFEEGDAVCTDDCTLTRSEDNTDYCNYEFTSDSDSGDSSGSENTDGDEDEDGDGGAFSSAQRGDDKYVAWIGIITCCLSVILNWMR